MTPGRRPRTLQCGAEMYERCQRRAKPVGIGRSLRFAGCDGNGGMAIDIAGRHAGETVRCVRDLVIVLDQVDAISDPGSHVENIMAAVEPLSRPPELALYPVQEAYPEIRHHVA